MFHCENMHFRFFFLFVLLPILLHRLPSGQSLQRSEGFLHIQQQQQLKAQKIINHLIMQLIFLLF